MSIQIAQITAEHHHNGFAIFHSRPRLSWRFKATSIKDWIQDSYTLIVERDSGKETYHVDSRESVLVPWPSSPLSSREIVTVRVQAFGRDGSSSDQATLHIEACLLQREDWKAAMISAPPQTIDQPKTPFRLKKSLTLAKLGRSRLYATAHGIYEVEINGKVVGDEVLAPGWQSYNHRLHFQTYDVTDYLVEGTNVICAYVAEGWFAGRLGRPGVSNIWGTRLGFLAQLETAGSIACITDDSWEHLSGPVVAAEIYNGEIWSSVGNEQHLSAISNETSGKAEVIPFPSAALIAPDVAPVRRVMEIKPQEIITTPSGKKILDFGQNLVGWLKVLVDIPGKVGDRVVIKHAEVLEYDELGTRPLRTARAENIIELGGSTKNYEPRFSWFGFRYAEITGYDQLELSDFIAIVISTDLRRTGAFESSHKLINRLHENTVWSTRGNFVSVPTDCPQRDERLGWTGDLQVFAPTANYLFDTTAFLSSWLEDLAADQQDMNGVVPTIIPRIPIPPRHPEIRPMAIWADSSIITPWDIYNSSGDEAVLRRQWDSMRLWLDHGLPRNKDNFYANVSPQYGDWLDPRSPPQLPGHSPTDPFLIANAYLIYVTQLAAKIAKQLGESEAASRYANDAGDLLTKYRNEYVTRTGRLASDTQAAYVIALLFGVFKDSEQVETAKRRLDWMIRWEAFKITTGFAGTPVILQVLADNGMLSHAYRMLQERDCPSWLYPVRMGATTIWERWNSMLPDGTINPGQMTSFNHYALGSVCDFLHKTVGGLRPTLPGWRRVEVCPRPGGTVRHARTSFDSPYGPYSVQWKIDGSKMFTTVTVPPNGEAHVKLNAVDTVIGSGTYNFETDWVEDVAWPPLPIQGAQGNEIPAHYIE